MWNGNIPIKKHPLGQSRGEHLCATKILSKYIEVANCSSVMQGKGAIHCSVQDYLCLVS